jgi:hypothetical protein
MNKQNKSIQEKLEGRTPATMRQVIKPVDMLEHEQEHQPERTNEHTKEQNNERSDERTEKRTSGRMRVRHSFDIYQDQLLSLKEIALHRQKTTGERVLLGDLVQEALDTFIKTNEQTDERSNK